MSVLFVTVIGTWTLLWLCLLASMSQRNLPFRRRSLTLFDSLEEYR
ncbi:hypothetical protein [Marilutibacter chinensis]|nr:hypothetical protein [Lysobacter chinensis]